MPERIAQGVGVVPAVFLAGGVPVAERSTPPPDRARSRSSAQSPPVFFTPAPLIVESELFLLTKALERCYRQLVDLRGRWDFTFGTYASLEELDRCCLWLYKKTYLEQAFFKKLHLERKLRSLISEEAYEVYQELLDVDEQEGEILSKDPAELRRLLLGDDARLPPPELQ